MKAIRQIGSLAFVVGLFTAIFAGVPWHVLTTDDPRVPWWLRIAIFLLLGGVLVAGALLPIDEVRRRRRLRRPQKRSAVARETVLAGRRVHRDVIL